MLYSLVALFAFSTTDFYGCQVRGSSICVFRTINDDSVPSRCKELLLGVLFLAMYEKICSSLALEGGIVNTVSAKDQTVVYSSTRLVHTA